MSNWTTPSANTHSPLHSRDRLFNSIGHIARCLRLVPFLEINSKIILTRIWKDDDISATTTHFFGQALTGQGIKNVYQDVMNEADAVYFLKGAHGFKVSDLLQKLGTFYSEKGLDIEYFLDPLFENTIEAIFIKGPHQVLIIQATNLAIQPVALGERDQVISLYDCVDEEQLTLDGELFSLNISKRTYFNQCFEALSKAISIHDDWEVETRKNMTWSGLNQQFTELSRHLFGDTKLNKSAELTHRLLGTLTPQGPRDTVQSITQNLEKRLFIKGYPGTGKSSMMKKFANDALSRGYDVQLVWCGLDSNSIDMVILPELKFCIFDSTEPHVYFPDENRPGDEVFDIAKHCHPTEVEEKNIQQIVAKYKATMAVAKQFTKQYAEIERKVREIIDAELDVDELDKRTAHLFSLIK